MRATTLLAAGLLTGLTFAADLPRKAPEFRVTLPDGKVASVSGYKGNVLCLAFISTT